jgi:hypothetical protein
LCMPSCIGAPVIWMPSTGMLMGTWKCACPPCLLLLAWQAVVHTSLTLAASYDDASAQGALSNCTSRNSSGTDATLPRYATLCSSGTRLAPLIRQARTAAGALIPPDPAAGVGLPPDVAPLWLLAPHMVVVGGATISSPHTATVARTDSAGEVLKVDHELRLCALVC